VGIRDQFGKTKKYLDVSLPQEELEIEGQKIKGVFQLKYLWSLYV
jgi:hypothetical protein